MKTRLLFLLTLCLMATAVAFGQKRSVTGKVLSQADGEPLIGVAISEKGTSNGTITGADGSFAINANKDAILVVSYVGYVTQQVKPVGNAPITIMLQEDSKLLDDVVVIGYGVQKKSDLTGAVASIKGDELKTLVTSDAAAALQGKAAGVQIINGGAPGEGAQIRVRGYSSNSGNIGPLLIVDGLKVDNIQYLDPSMIESMEVLKDAASAAIYGAQAGNGVVIITTKTGAESNGVAHISYNFKAASQSLGKKAEIFNAQEYIEYHKYLGDLTDKILSDNGYDGTDTDWYDETFENSWMTQHDITIQGGNNKGHLLANLNILNNDGIVKGDKDVYKRLTGQINADYQFFKWLNVSSNTSIEKWSSKGVTNGYGSFLNSVVSIDPLTPAYYDKATDSPLYTLYNSNDAHGNVVLAPDGRFYGTSKYVEEATGNPLAQRDRRNATNQGINVRGTIAANITPLEGLTITSRLGYRITQSNSHEYLTPYYLTSMAHSENYSISANTNTGLYYQWENFVNYNKSFGKHNVGAMVGMSFTKNHWDNSSISSSDSKLILNDPNPSYQYIDFLTKDSPKTVGNAPGDATELAYFGRLSYNYDNRYFFQFNIRRDAFDSSKLSKDARWGTFPSLSAGWTVSNEKFFKNLVNEDAVSYLKLRGSWGRNGNVNVLSGYKYAAGINVGGYYMFNPSMGTGALVNGARPTGIANPDLTWETSEQIDLGLDARFLNDRLSFSIDWYRKMTKDLLIEISPLPEVGVSKSTVNTGKVLNTGFDFELGWKDHIGDLKYSINTNFSTLKNEVREVSVLLNRIDAVGIDGFNNELKPAFEAGYPVWYFRGYKYAGVSNGSNQDRDKNVIPEGHAMFYDKDGNITTAPQDADKQYLGEGIPSFTYGITLNLEYKGFDFTVFGTGAYGNEIYNLMVSADRPLINGISTYWKDSWKQAGDNAKYPDMKNVKSNWKFYSSDAAVFSGAYFKFKQIQLGYTIPAKYTKKALLSKVRVSVSLDDFFTITSYPGADPETASINGTSSRGFDNGTYPTSKKVVFGLNLTF